jgi:hypothetical protein
MLNAFMLNVIMLSAFMLNVIMLSVVAPLSWLVTLGNMTQIGLVLFIDIILKIDTLMAHIS